LRFIGRTLSSTDLLGQLGLELLRPEALQHALERGARAGHRADGVAEEVVHGVGHRGGAGEEAAHCGLQDLFHRRLAVGGELEGVVVLRADDGDLRLQLLAVAWRIVISCTVPSTEERSIMPTTRMKAGPVLGGGSRRTPAPSQRAFQTARASGVQPTAGGTVDSSPVGDGLAVAATGGTRAARRATGSAALASVGFGGAASRPAWVRLAGGAA
jgi:hypothetical protein